MSRKPIIINPCSYESDMEVAVGVNLTVICDDGSIWMYWTDDTDPEWIRLPDIPQEDGDANGH